VFDIKELAGVVDGAEVASFGADVAAVSAGRVETDTRKDLNGALFLALKGERFDGHDFVDAAAAGGAAAVCVSSEYAESRVPRFPVPALVVPDTLKALQSIAAWHRWRFPGLKVVGITGSSGKTSVKEMIRSILVEAFGSDAVLATEGNTNNHIGLPMNLLRAVPEHRVAVLELGTNHPGEIEVLAEIAAPDIAVATSIGNAHIEFFGDLDGVAREKGTIFKERSGPGGKVVAPIAILPAECPGRSILLEYVSGEALSFGFDDSATAKVDYESLDATTALLGLRVSAGEGARGEFDVKWGLGGRHQASNAAAAALVAARLGALDAVPAGLANCELPGMRMKVEEIDGVTWINDAYNANPDSVRAAVDRVAEIAESRDILVVLGDMFELGSESARLHEETLEFVARRLPDADFALVGGTMSAAAGRVSDMSGRFDAYAAAEELSERFRSDPPSSGGIVFLKGSRGMGLERCVPKNAGGPVDGN